MKIQDFFFRILTNSFYNVFALNVYKHIWVKKLCIFIARYKLIYINSPVFQLYFLSCAKEIILEYYILMDTYNISIKTIVH